MRKTAYILTLLLALAACSQDASVDLKSQDAYDNIFYSKSADMSNPKRLDGATVSGDIYVWFEPDSKIERVKFYLNDVWVDKRTESIAPYALSGDVNGTLKALDTSELGTGELSTGELGTGRHEVVASVQTVDGSFEEWRAYFEVARSAPVDALWTGDMEEGNLDDFYKVGSAGSGGEFNNGNATSSATHDYAHSGKYSSDMT